MTNILIIASKEIRDAMRNKWFLLISLIFAGLSLAFSILGVSGLGNLGISGFGRTTASLINLVLLIVPLMGLLLGSISLSSEKEHGTLRALLAQPVTLGEIFIGKYLGSVFALSATLCVGFGLSGIVIGIFGGWEQLSSYLGLLGYTVLLAIVYLGIGFLISVFCLKMITAIGVSIFLWFLFVFLSDLGIMGTTVALNLSSRDLLWIVLTNPAQSFKAVVIGILQGDLDILGTLGRYAVDVLGDQFILALSGILLIWAVGPFLSAFLLFKKRCGE